MEEVSKEGAKKSPSPGYPLVCVTPCDPHFPKYSVMKERCEEAGINQSTVVFSWEVAAPTDSNGARSPFETITDTTPFTGVNHMVSACWTCKKKLSRESVEMVLTNNETSELCYPPWLGGRVLGA